MNNILPVILSGGSGSRLWPLSRSGYPKQFLSLTGEGHSLFQSTLERVATMANALPPLVVCNEDHRFLVAEQAKALSQLLGPILLEPLARNTAPAITLAAIKAMEEGQDPLLLVLPSDHVFSDVAAFHQVVHHAAELASTGHLVTFGICPTRAETGYGYIKAGDAVGHSGYGVERFVEKPPVEVAQAYIDQGGYYWNSGMFLFRASTYLAELNNYQPELQDHCQKALAQPITDLFFCRVDPIAFAACPAVSVDYAVMEKTTKAVVLPLNTGWNDIGAWPAVREISAQDEQGNATQGDVLLLAAHDNLVHAQSRLVCGIGIENLTIIETPDVVLVMPHEQAQNVKSLVDQLKQNDRREVITHRQVLRPWGYYEAIDEGHRFKVKRIMVKPGEKLSLQLHHHRAEHWIVVSGTAQVTVDGQTQFITENQSTFIPLGLKHRLENPGKVDLHMVEVQSGTYLDEDDIVRFEDHYGRHDK